jgi:transposase-like protein
VADGIAGRRMYLWRAVDHQGEILDMLVQRRRDKRAALRLMRRLLKKQGFGPKLLVSDKLRSPRLESLRDNLTKAAGVGTAAALVVEVGAILAKYFAVF